MANIKTIGFDADDTLWHCENLFQEAHEQFAQLMSGYVDREELDKTMLEQERSDLPVFGYGIKAFTLSMMMAATKIAGEKLNTQHVKGILDIGRELTLAPVELLPNVHEVIEGLAEDYELVLITKGDLKDQERKIADSNLSDYFETLEIVSDKTSATYTHVFDRHQGIEHAVMVGNSMKSDVLPAIDAGAWGIHVPYHITWALEEAIADEHPKLLVAESLQEAARKIRRITT